jgi:hypothetical protein
VEPDPVAALDGVELEALHRLRSDSRIWTLSDVQAALHLADRKAVLKLWRTTCNYLYGGHREWPPRGTVLTRRLPDAGAPVTDLWWPSYTALLPPPDLPGSRVQPRWYAGTIMTWAVQVGRLRLPDLAPIKATPRGGHDSAPAPVDLSDISLKQLQALVDDDNLWTIQDIEEFFGVIQETAQRWARATRNRFERGITTWPPGAEEGRQATSDPDGTGLSWWPSHPRLLPPPKGTDSGGRARYYGSGDARYWSEARFLWRAGDVKKWALEVGRLLPDGTVVRLH